MNNHKSICTIMHRIFYILCYIPVPLMCNKDVAVKLCNQAMQLYQIYLEVVLSMLHMMLSQHSEIKVLILLKNQ